MKISTFSSIVMVLALLSLLQCDYLQGEQNRYFGKGNENAIASTAIHGVLSNTIMGTIYFSEENKKGLKISGEIAGLLPGNTYAMHILESGSCDSVGKEFKDFDPGKSGRHGEPWQSPGQHHAGDLPNVKAGSNGKVVISMVTSNFDVSDSSTFSALNHVVALFSNADDYTTQPTGNSGQLIACGIIVRKVAAKSPENK
jgi:superoxide dismutase, Cu-Zn family